MISPPVNIGDYSHMDFVEAFLQVGESGSYGGGDKGVLPRGVGKLVERGPGEACFGVSYILGIDSETHLYAWRVDDGRVGLRLRVVFGSFAGILEDWSRGMASGTPTRRAA